LATGKGKRKGPAVFTQLFSELSLQNPALAPYLNAVANRAQDFRSTGIKP
jgi:hypothetical protein